MSGPRVNSDVPQTRPWRVIVAYALMLAAAAALFFVIRAFGESPSSAATGTTTAQPRLQSPTGDVLFHVLLALVAIIVTGRGLGLLFTRLGQPPVVVEEV